MNKSVLNKTNFKLEGQTGFYRGKVRDVYNVKDKYWIMIATDRISAFDVVLPRGIPFKGQVLNQIALRFLDDTGGLVPNWKIASPDPMVTVGHYCQPIPIEMIIRGYLTGSSWRTYQNGKREICGVSLPEGLREHEKFPEPIITPTTKAAEGHDEDISREEILEQGIVTEEDYALLEKYTRALYAHGAEVARKKGLILVDTKYEFGKKDGRIFLIDEIHTPDSSRYFYLDGYDERFKRGEPQKQLSKEFVREWLMQKGFQGKTGQPVPEMNDDFVNSVSERYIELYEKITGESFIRPEEGDVAERVKINIEEFLGSNP
ncbi:MAG: phosphoribosylaminoimidazolesuccinocarboxamide synthase [Bacteroidales bacterium]|nr:phosphoribosylaminoimidazolesuccinocarboxamide synthase [Bacteroidales bacterium]